MECLVHVIELLFRHFFCFVEGPSKSPDKLAKNAVYNLIGSINETVENMSVLDEFSTVPCPVISKNIIKRIIDAIESGEIELRDDRACFFAYTAIAIGLNIPDCLRRFLSYKQENHGLARWMTSGRQIKILGDHKRGIISNHPQKLDSKILI